MLNQLRILLVILAISLQSSCVQAIGSMKFYYFPFELETFTPITIEDIELRARCSFSLDNVSDQNTVKSYLMDRTGGSFEYKRVRLKVILNQDKTFYVDAEGGSLEISEKGQQIESELSAKAFDNLKTWVAEACRNKNT